MSLLQRLSMRLPNRGPSCCTSALHYKCCRCLPLIRTRSVTRWMRLSLNRCPVYFYERAQVETLLRQSGWQTFDIHRLSRDYLVCARL